MLCPVYMQEIDRSEFVHTAIGQRQCVNSLAMDEEFGKLRYYNKSMENIYWHRECTSSIRARIYK